MKQMTKAIFFLLMMIIGVASCSEDIDGKWPNMKWDVPSSITKVDGVYRVPATGGTYTFTCKNYRPWIAGISEVDEHSENKPIVQDYHSYEGTWCSVNCEQNDVTFTFQPLTGDGDGRNLLVVLTAGDIFHTFKFIQE